MHLCLLFGLQIRVLGHLRVVPASDDVKLSVITQGRDALRASSHADISLA